MEGCGFAQPYFKNVSFLNLNLRNNLRKTEGGGGGNWKPEVLLEENKGGQGGDLEMFLQRENRKNLRYFHTVPIAGLSLNVELLKSTPIELCQLFSHHCIS